MSTNPELDTLRQENDRLKRELEIAALNQKNAEVRLESAKLAMENSRKPWIFQKESWAAIGAACLVLIPAYQQWSSAKREVAEERENLRIATNDLAVARQELDSISTNKSRVATQVKELQDQKTLLQQEKETLEKEKADLTKKTTELRTSLQNAQSSLTKTYESITKVSSSLTRAASQLKAARAAIRPQVPSTAILTNVNIALSSITTVEEEVKIIEPLLRFKAIHVTPVVPQ